MVNFCKCAGSFFRKLPAHLQVLSYILICQTRGLGKIESGQHQNKAT